MNDEEIIKDFIITGEAIHMAISMDNEIEGLEAPDSVTVSATSTDGMKIIKQGEKTTKRSTRKSFRCTCCNCEFTADPKECVQLRTPIKPNVYSWCPNCGSQVWEKDGEQNG